MTIPQAAEAVDIQADLPGTITTAAMTNPSGYNTADSPTNAVTTTIGFGGKLWKVIGYITCPHFRS